MPDLAALRDLKQRLPRTWDAFFARHGSFTAAQTAAIPPLLAGRDLFLCAPTASGKTAAVLAPLIERYCLPGQRPAGPVLLYLVPTRALVNDLAARLAYPLDTLGIGLGVRTGDTNSFRPRRPPALLITTPESLDSLLTTQARLFATLQAVVLDEVHLFHGTPRGDQVRLLLNRLRHLRAYAHEQGDAPHSHMQGVGLSATLPQPQQVAAHYFPQADILEIAGSRRLVVEYLDLSDDDEDGLLSFLAAFRAHGWRKALVFCNSRAEVEQYATITRPRSPFGNAVYVHYSNVSPHRRREIEQQFAQDEAAICFASSTLELGIDIGSIDVIVLLGPPGTTAAFVQRIGRGNRRRASMQVVCGYRTAFERLLFETLVAAPSMLPEPAAAALRPSVVVQQIFSLIKQSPVGAVRLSDVLRLCAGAFEAADLEQMLGHLVQRGYLSSGRPGEWRAGARLLELLDQQQTGQVTRSIHSTIQASASRQITIRNQQTQAVVANVDSFWINRDVLTLEGRPMDVTWYDGEALWVNSAPDHALPRQNWYRSTRQVLSYELAQQIPLQMGLPAGAAPLVRAPTGWWWFHWLGDRYGKALEALLRYRVPVRATPYPGLCVAFSEEPLLTLDWSAEQVVDYLRDTYREWESLLDLGAFHNLLPTALRRQAVVQQFDVARFLRAVANLYPCSALAALDTSLTDMLAEA